MFSTSTPKKAVLLQSDSVRCLVCGTFLRTIDHIAIFGHSQWSLKGTMCKLLEGELQMSDQNSLYICN